MDIDYEIIDYSEDDAQVLVRYTAPGMVPLQLPLPIPVVNGELTTDPARIHNFIIGASPRAFFERQEAVARAKAEPAPAREARRTAFVGSRGRVTAMIDETPLPSVAKLRTL